MYPPNRDAAQITLVNMCKILHVNVQNIGTVNSI